jgi:hypothetical protein
MEVTEKRRNLVGINLSIMLVTKRQNKKWKLRVQSRVFAWKESLCEGLTKKGQLNIDSMEKSVKEMTYINIMCILDGWVKNSVVKGSI